LCGFWAPANFHCTTPQYLAINEVVCFFLLFQYCRVPSKLHERVVGIVRLLGPRHWASWRLLLLGTEMHCGVLEQAVLQHKVLRPNMCFAHLVFGKDFQVSGSVVSYRLHLLWVHLLWLLPWSPVPHVLPVCCSKVC
jgi:hypothetical protein